MSKKKIERSLAKRMDLRFIIVAAICALAIITVDVMIVWLSESIPKMKEIGFIRFWADGVEHLVIISMALFCLSLFIIAIVQRSQLISYLAELSGAVSSVGNSSTRPAELPAVLRETQDAIHTVTENIRQKENAAREAEQRKNDLVVYLAHDLKTPITSIIGYLTLLRDEKELSTELHDRYVETVLGNSERLDDLINEFFEITRFNLSHITLEYSKIDLTRLLEQLVFEFKPLLAEKGLSCSLEIPSKIELQCDADKIERVFDNLLRNAINYSHAGTKIHIAAQVTENITLTFANHGNTIPKEKLNRIFDQFYRLDSSRSSKTGGSGLGLAIAKQIVELHHGMLSAESENEEIRFTITIPVNENASVGKS